ncbi:SymE family type I addiction module toxin [Emticicia sp.]|uniref:SymE family type I addiction module toxin n=1 Tax=Emticicia sp. TaxID=1930953 RepID=UPI0037536FC3
MKNNRKIRVYAKIKFCRKHLNLTSRTSQIILSGNWLVDAGFNFGDSVNIEVTDKKLVLSIC